jgi:3D-(3,5/4)-trihydroxycyclohexane-1,2-dione acylhydrolase (decyclizing)
LFTATNAPKLVRALEQAKAAPITTVVYVPIDSQERVRGFEGWWDVPIAEVSGQPDVRATRATYETDRAKQCRFI